MANRGAGARTRTMVAYPTPKSSLEAATEEGYLQPADRVEWVGVQERADGEAEAARSSGLGGEEGEAGGRSTEDAAVGHEALRAAGATLLVFG
ncbi:hypothetical protein ON010_g8105 [Phytophthora cinnamomi]|nr:hypothetical protein ON010_g8105 [Phytophthora cinnamomi]